MYMPCDPHKFDLLCGRIGLAIMLGQKVQYALAGYFATYSRVHLSTSLEQARLKLDFHLSKTMGNVVFDIERLAPLPEDLWGMVRSFKDERNWLVHDFDQEATPFLVRGERISEYIARMESISSLANEIIQRLDIIGEELVP